MTKKNKPESASFPLKSKPWPVTEEERLEFLAACESVGLTPPTAFRRFMKIFPKIAEDNQLYELFINSSTSTNGGASKGKPEEVSAAS